METELVQSEKAVLEEKNVAYIRKGNPVFVQQEAIQL